MNRQKRKGVTWEREFVELVNSIPECSAKRIAGSGAFGTQLDEPQLTGDVVFAVNDFPRKFRFECKTGYGNETQLTIKREWFDKIKEEASKTMSIPGVALKFSGVRAKGQVRYIIAFDFETFVELLTYCLSLKKELDLLYDRANGLGFG